MTAMLDIDGLAHILPLLLKINDMNKILLGALVCAAVAGIVYYFYDPEKFTETVDDLKNKADDAFTKVKDTLSKSGDVRNAVS